MKSVDKKLKSFPVSFEFDSGHYREMRRRNIIRLLFTYIGPLVFLAVFFFFQYDAIVSESRRLHLKAIAESQANTLDLFLTERLVNLSNLIDDPTLQHPPTAEAMRYYLGKLEKSSETFVDIGYFDSSGVQAGYAGPFPALEQRNYSTETWFVDLRKKIDRYIITDIYLGFRGQPHFTMAVSRIADGEYFVMRATLAPEKIYDYIQSLEGAQEVYTSIVNREGYYQLVTSHIGTPLEGSSFVPPENPPLESGKMKIGGESFVYAYSWLKMARWALIVQWLDEQRFGLLSGHRLNIILMTLGMVLLGLVIIHFRAKKVTEMYIESEGTRRQLEHAAKLASVGELAAGIAHEINNPLAAINEEAGLIKDFLDPEIPESIGPEEMREHLDSIQESVFRCRDITRKLLSFVRKTDIDLRKHNVNQIIDEVVDGLLGPEIVVSKIDVIRQYDQDIPLINTDGNQLQQVILNMLNNGADAIGNISGTITIKTSCMRHDIKIDITDTGQGMSTEQMEKIFLPFYTTKEVGKGTGLGLSVSYGIIKSLGGKIEVDSDPGKGSTFTLVLPINSKALRVGT